MKRMTPMIEVITDLYQQYSSQCMAWYHAAGILTQYAVIIAFGITFFLISVFMILARIAR